MKQVQRGFTLIELVMVIVIIGVLAAVAIPKFVNLSGDARDAAAQGVAGSISSGSAINYGAKMAGNANAVAVNTATECTKANLDRFVSGITLKAGDTLANATAATPDGVFDVLTTQVGVCTSGTIAAGTAVACEIAAHGGTKVAPVTIICTGA